MKVNFIDGTSINLSNASVFLDINVIRGTYGDNLVVIPLTSVKYWVEK